MTREEAKAFLPIIQAFANGKEIEFNDSIEGWITIKGDSLGFVFSPVNYRIKLGLKYRPFKTQEECWQEMLKHQPFGWIKKPDGELFCIDRVFDGGVAYRHSSCMFDEYIESGYTFADGTPFGIKEE